MLTTPARRAPVLPSFSMKSIPKDSRGTVCPTAGRLTRLLGPWLLLGSALPVVPPAPLHAASTSANAATATAPRVIGEIERRDPALDALLAPDAVIEQLAEGFDWSEGPVWDPRAGHLLFSDVPQNRIYRWHPTQGLSVFLEPSGFTGLTESKRRQGSNGLTFDAAGRLLLCQHGDRRIARLETDGRSFTTLADRWETRRFNSPNDLCQDSAGRIYFTDPPYGLANDEPRDLDFHGVYRLDSDGKVTLLTQELERPNGIALSPDGKRLYVANSHRPRPVIMSYPLDTSGSIGAGTVLFDATPFFANRPGHGGVPDGLKVDERGNLWTTGPGGVLILRPDGHLLGRILPGHTTANCAWGDDGRTLYLTSDGVLARVRTRVAGPLR
jgi:gluconolactonase